MHRKVNPKSQYTLQVYVKQRSSKEVFSYLCISSGAWQGHQHNVQKKDPGFVAGKILHPHPFLREWRWRSRCGDTAWNAQAVLEAGASSKADLCKGVEERRRVVAGEDSRHLQCDMVGACYNPFFLNKGALNACSLLLLQGSGITVRSVIPALLFLWAMLDVERQKRGKHNLLSQKQGLEVFWRLCPPSCQLPGGTRLGTVGKGCTKSPVKRSVKRFLGWGADPQPVKLTSSASSVSPAPLNYGVLAGGISLPQPDPCESGRVLRTAGWRGARYCCAFMGSWGRGTRWPWVRHSCPSPTAGGVCSHHFSPPVNPALATAAAFGSITAPKSLSPFSNNHDEVPKHGNWNPCIIVLRQSRLAREHVLKTSGVRLAIRTRYGFTMTRLLHDTTASNREVFVLIPPKTKQKEHLFIIFFLANVCLCLKTVSYCG